MCISGSLHYVSQSLKGIASLVASGQFYQNLEEKTTQIAANNCPKNPTIQCRIVHMRRAM